MTLARLAALSLAVAPAATSAADPAAATAGEDSDALFLRARRLSGKETRAEARALCRRALERSPDYADVRIHLGRLHAWDGQWPEGRAELGRVLEREPGNGEARQALVDLEWWADRPDEALRQAEAGLALEPDNVGLLHRKARLLRGRGEIPAALEAVRAALSIDPDHQPSRLLRDDLRELAQRSKVSLDSTVDTFDRTFDPWLLVAVAVTHRFDLGSVTLRASRADRFGSSGHQVELDAYPRIREGTYAYLNAGGSGDAVFPRFRAGAELYQSLPAGWELSAGLRHLRFSGDPVTVWTGTVSRYLVDWLFTLRPSVTPGAAGSSVSGALTARWYLDDAESFLSATAGAGVSPDQASPTAEILRLRAFRGGLSAQKRIGRSFVLWGGATVERQEYGPGAWRLHGAFNLGCEQRF